MYARLLLLIKSERERERETGRGVSNIEKENVCERDQMCVERAKEIGRE